MVLILHVILSAAPSHAKFIEAGRSARCAAFLEHQTYEREAGRREFEAILHEVGVRAGQERRRIYGDQTMLTGDFDDHFVHIWLDPSAERPPANYSWALAMSFANIDRRLSELADDVYAIRDGVAGGGLVRRGREPVLAHLASVERDAIRNQAQAEAERPRPRLMRAFARLRRGEALAIKSSRERRLIELVGDADRHPGAFVYRVERRRLSEAEADELRAAARHGRVPNRAFRDRHDAHTFATVAPIFDPVTYVFETDVIYFYDEAKREPVLLSFDRLRREVDVPPPPPRRRVQSAFATAPALTGPAAATFAASRIHP